MNFIRFHFLESEDGGDKLNENMYSIGQFSAMMDLNKKTLRYYDDIGLFKPVLVDKNNQYRYYEESQIGVINKILSLKEIGIPLEQIKNIISNPDKELLQVTYNKRIKEIDVLIAELNIQKELIEKKLNPPSDYQDSIYELKVEKGDFIHEGLVYYNDIDCDFADIHKAISEFYANNKELVLTSSHFLKRSLEEQNPGFVEIFAYAEANGGTENTRIQNKLSSMKVECKNLTQRQSGYKILFDEATKNLFDIHTVFEKYTFKQGRMHLELICSIN
jgi:DNA-binding transcriptional MerR regulator